MSKEFSESDWSSFLKTIDQSPSQDLYNQKEEANTFFDKLISKIETQISENTEINLPEGHQIGNYRITSKIGQGGMATVYKAERSDGIFDQQVAIKVLSRLLSDEIYQESFASERRLLAKLNHPSIAKILDGGAIDQGAPYFVMEFIEGQPIDLYCKEHRTNERDKIHLFLKAVKAVQNAHSNFILHRDIKPANILITQDQEVKLLDFGIAKFLNTNQETNHTQSGTPRYYTPEQLNGDDLSPKSDIYQLGILLYELLTKKYPFEGLTEPHRKKAILASDFEDPKSLNTRITKDINSIVIKCLNPNDGYESVASLVIDLENLDKRYPVSARKPTRAYTFSLFLKRNKLAAVLTFLIVATALLAAVLSRLQTLEIKREQQKTLTTNNFLNNIFKANNPKIAQGEEITVRSLLKSSEAEIENIDDPEIKAFTQIQLGKLYKHMGLWKESGPLFLNASTIYENNSFASELDKAHAYREISGYYRDISAYAKADSIMVIGIDLLLSNPKEGYALDLAACYKDRAKLLHMLGEYKDGEKEAKKALEKIQEAKKSNLKKSTYTESIEAINISALNYLGSNIRDQSRYQEALEICKEAVEQSKKIKKQDIGKLLFSLNNLAMAYNRLTDYDMAIEIYTYKLDIAKEIYKEDHPSYILSLTNLGSAYYKSEDLVKSDSLSKIAYDLYLSKFGPNHNYTVSTLYNIANSKYSQGAYKEAHASFLKVLEADINNFDTTHPYVGGDYVSLGLVAHKQKDYTQAETYLQKAFKIYYDKFGEKHQKTSYSYSLLGDLYNDIGQKDKAISYYEKAVAINLEVLGSDHKYYKDYVKVLNQLNSDN